MLSMVEEQALTKEERERENYILAGQIEVILESLSRKGSVPDELYVMLRDRLKELELMPAKPLGTSFWRYVGELVKPLRAGLKQTESFIKNWKGW